MKLVDGTIETGKPRFERLYVYLEACKQGFKAGCRKLVGVDGCHLKRPHRGILFAAISVYANNCKFPIAYAIIESEN